MTYSRTPLAEKLQVKPDAVVWLRHAPDKAREAIVDSLPEGARTAEPDDRKVDSAIVFVSRAAQLEAEFRDIQRRLRNGDPLLWLAYPTAGQLETDLSREHGWGPVEAAGFEPVRAVDINDVWTALRWRKQR